MLCMLALQPLPTGHPDCLTGKSVVFTGLLDSTHREDAKSLVQRHGGRVVGSVSGVTSYLVVGSNASRGKFDKVIKVVFPALLLPLHVVVVWLAVNRMRLTSVLWANARCRFVVLGSLTFTHI